MEKAKLRQYARDLRHNSTDTEKHLWYYLRANRLGHKFKRQVPIEGFIVDFVCFQKRLIIELDGGQHLIDQEKGNQRTAKLEACGFRVFRFWNHEVLQSAESVLASIHSALSPSLSQP
jgi:very-short-patch-repair endonuclease